jgi:signal transduction histidine kinase
MEERVPAPESRPDPGPIPSLHLDDLLSELQGRLQEILSTRDRSHSLLEAIVAVGSELDLPTVLRRIVEAAVKLADATYGALGVIGEPERLSQFVTVGLGDEERARIGALPSGRGIIGLLIREPEPLRLKDLRQHPASFGFPPNHPPMSSFLGVPVRVRGEVFGNLYLTDKRSGGEFDEEDERAVVALAAAVGVAVENARLYDEARQRERWLQASAEVTTTLLSGTDPSDALAVVARRARELAAADVAIIALPSRDGTLVVEIADGPEADKLRGLVLPMTGSLVGEAFSTGEPVTVSELGPEGPLGAALGPDRPGAAMLVPLGEAPAVTGVLGVVMPVGAPAFGTHSVAMLRAFAGQAAVALQLAEARRDAERVGLYEDRDRIARDLHDLVIQRLFASGMQLESCTRLIENSEAVTRVRHVVDELDGTIREIRSAIYALHTPTGTGPRTVRTELLEVTDTAAQALGFAPSVQFDGPVDTAIPAQVCEQMVAVLVEALSNVARHAKAHRVSIVVSVDDRSASLRVRDDGVGLPAGGRRSGLTNLAERAAELDGTFSASGSGSAGGTDLVWTVPLSSA